MLPLLAALAAARLVDVERGAAAFSGAWLPGSGLQAARGHPSPLHVAARAARARSPALRLASYVGPGVPGKSDDEDFAADPAGFCRKRARESGPVFATGVGGGTVFVGDPTSLAALARTPAVSVATGASSSELAAPFARVAEPSLGSEAAFAEMNAVVYDAMFQWIPKVKEAGFSTFRFSDFLDERVRRLMPSVRKVVLYAASPLLFGAPAERLFAQLGFDSLVELGAAYEAHAKGLRPANPSDGFALPSLEILARQLSQTGDAQGTALKAGLAAWKQRAGDQGALGAERATGEALLWELESTVEQTAALACSLIVAAQRHKAVLQPFFAELNEALTGTGPTAAISLEDLASMPQLEAFTKEVLRLYPPARPARVRLEEALRLPPPSEDSCDWEGAPCWVTPIEVPAGTVVAPEPWVAHRAVATGPPDDFQPSRFLQGTVDAPLIPFGTAVPGEALAQGPYGELSGGARLSVALAQMIFVQSYRMFEKIVINADQDSAPSGTILHAVKEKLEVLVKPKVYYELQRDVKKLRF